MFKTIWIIHRFHSESHKNNCPLRRPPSDRRQQTANSYESVAENLQRFRRTLRETLIRREANARESRMFNRLSHPSNPCTDAPRVISDGPAYTPQRDIGPHQVIGNPQSFDFRNAEPPVITLDEVIYFPFKFQSPLKTKAHLSQTHISSIKLLNQVLTGHFIDYLDFVKFCQSME